ncbi:MAG: hypothetical protein Q7S27_04190 [Nanoarchaeota archaeon]|nr:hypothetical protein [Nanoarchaeota archaeon]
MILDWYAITLQGLQDLWQGFIGFLPSLVGALLIFFIGWVISVAVGKLVGDILKRLNFNKIFEKGNWDETLAKAGIKVDAAAFIGSIFKWSLTIVFLLASVEVLGLTELAGFLKDVLAYLPNVVVASLIFVVAVIIADLSEKILRVLVESTQIGHGHLVGVIVRWSIWIFALIAILMQLGIAPMLLQTVLTGLVALIVIAGGLAFGLGGKEMAAELLADLKRKLKG